MLARDGTLVVRPDSGDPSATVLRVLQELGAAFGTEVNAAGYKLLPPQVRVIQGDGVELASIDAILGTLKDAGWCADNVAFGMGGALLQRMHRDTLEFAFKCSAVTRGGRSHDVYKDPVTGHDKRSKAGRLALVRGRDGLHTRRQGEGGEDLLVPVFRDGRVLVRLDFETVRRNAALPDS